MGEGRTFAVVGGGAAGVTCAQELGKLCTKDDVVVLFSSQKLVKQTVVLENISETIKDVGLVFENGEEFFADFHNIKYVNSAVQALDPDRRIIMLDTGESIRYDDICICTGASPKCLLESDCVTTLRDSDSIASLCGKLERCSSLMVVGNGGIALDVVASIPHIETFWVVRHESIGDAFFDGEVGQFLLEDLQYMRNHVEFSIDCFKTKRGTKVQETTPGASVGPSWIQQLIGLAACSSTKAQLHIERLCEVTKISRNQASGRIDVTLSNGKLVSVDTVISAIGVDPSPNISWIPGSILRAPDGGIQVSTDMRTSFPHVYAAGDACTVLKETNSCWFQMRLWSQARFMGLRAAHSMLNIEDQMASDLPFDLFIHVTHFLGKRVVLLGCFNGQNLEQVNEDDSDSIRLYSRILGDPPGRNFVRVLLKNGKIKGAICIGETGLEETLENLIMDGIDVSSFGPDLLDPDCGLDDIFD